MIMGTRVLVLELLMSTRRLCDFGDACSLFCCFVVLLFCSSLFCCFAVCCLSYVVCSMLFCSFCSFIVSVVLDVNNNAYLAKCFEYF